MMRTRIGGVVLLVLLGVLIRVMHRGEAPPPNPRGVTAEISADAKLLVTETVDPKTGNLHLTIPIRATRKAGH
jgi:hypothetical protein